MAKLRKEYVLDTSVLVHDPKAIFKFENNLVVIPLIVLEELEHLKTREFNAREAIRVLERKFRSKDLCVGGFSTENGGSVRIYKKPDDIHIPRGFSVKLNDNHVIGTALALMQEQLPVKRAKKNKAPYPREHTDVIVVSKDVALRLKAIASGVQAQDYRADKVSTTLYQGYRELQTNDEMIAALYEDGISITDIPALKNACLNEYIVLTGGTEKRTALAAVRKEGRVVPVEDAEIKTKTKVQGKTTRASIRRRNRLQAFALDALMDPAVSLVTITGMAGTGKTYLALAAGIDQVGGGAYKRTWVGRNPIPLGKDVGFLPGRLEEKLDPWMGSIYDNLEEYFGQTEHVKDGEKIRQKPYQYLFDTGQLSVLSLLHLRGRSITNSFIIIDEAQNLTPHEVKTIVTRIGKGSKVVFLGDPNQIDNPYLDFESNGLSYLVERMKSQAIAAHINLVEGERSEVAEIGTRVL